MALSLLNFTSMVNLAAAAAQKSSAKLANLAVGSATRAILESSASVGLWMQYQIVQVWLRTRLATSTGEGVDSFLADFTLARQPAVAATGLVTFGRLFGISTLIVPYFNLDGTINLNGTTVLTADTTQTFGVVAEPTHENWDETMGGYFMPTAASGLTLPVQALVPGVGGNIQPFAISLVGIGLPGIDTATNDTAFSNGQDAETDDAARGRFQSFIATRARATVDAVANAVGSVQQGLSFAIIENTLPTGEEKVGFFTVTIDDSTGDPPTSLIDAVYAAVDFVRPIGSTFTVMGPAVLPVSVNMTISASPGYSKTTLQGLVAAAIETFINTLGIGHPLSYTRLSALAFGVTGVATVSNVLLNNGTADVGGGPTQTVKATGASVVIN